MSGLCVRGKHHGGTGRLRFLEAVVILKRSSPRCTVSVSKESRNTHGVLKHSDVHLLNQTEELVSQEVRPAELCPQLCSQRLRQQCGGFDIFKGKRSSVIHAFLHLAFDTHAQASADVVLTQEPVECGLGLLSEGNSKSHVIALHYIEKKVPLTSKTIRK